ncbi:MAG: magnesium transporter [Magnetococcales bacterium]|nr:magnesium transporter [Magnetococcales bacterium]
MTDNNSENLSAISHTSPPKQALLQAIDPSNDLKVTEVVENLGFEKTAHVIQGLNPEEHEKLFSQMSPQVAAKLIKHIPIDQATSVMQRMDDRETKAFFSTLDMDDKAEIVSHVADSSIDRLLGLIDDENEAAKIRQKANYKPGTAGHMMLLQVLVIPKTETVGKVLRYLGSEDVNFKRYSGQFYPYVIDEQRRILGVLSILNLLSEDRTTPAINTMKSAVTVTADTDLDSLGNLFKEHTFFNLPVVDDDNRILGIINRQTVEEALIERAGSDAMKTAGVVGDETRTMPVWLRARRRLSWLSANILLNILAASVIAAYEETLAAVIAIAIFLPMVSDMSGCSGNQAVAVSLRELALKAISPKDMFQVWIKEVSVGLINGVVLGILIGCVAWFWKDSAALGFVIGSALTMNTLIAVSVGGLVPLILKRFNVDPAVAAGPLLTTITDMAGFFLVLSMASFMMKHLV